MNTTPFFLDAKPVSYLIGEQALDSSYRLVEKYPRYVLLVDDNTREHCLPVFREHLPELLSADVICIESGEQKKNLDQALFIWNELTRLNVDRDALMVNLGGGVLTDIGGFVAATYKRGIDFANVPTTLLGMVDASIGGKTGIDFGKFKNQVGLFVDPVAVIIDPVFLKTLEEKHWQSGFAEVLKYGLIMDRELWQWLYGKDYHEIDFWDKIIVRAARDKIDIVRHDFEEKGVRKNLNFGHTVGHAFESFFLKNNRPITHGQAIAAGMICEAYISEKLTDLECSHKEEIVEMIDKNFSRLSVTEEDVPMLFDLMRQDKKVREGKLRFSLLKRLGKAVHDKEVGTDVVLESLEFYMHDRSRL
ncbi:MAG: 3-dehydroquinate synthase [Chlorobi bacterium]|nr:3-dehydroquinate synthase [Chlorobiota bacterium]